MSRPVVQILARYVTNYRRPFFDHLRHLLNSEDIELEVLFGTPPPSEMSKRDSQDLPWGTRIDNRIFQLGHFELYWQPVLRRSRASDLVIVEQASKLLVNNALVARQHMGGTPVAFWGHGRNLQGHQASRIGEVLKRGLSTKVHWWFAYTELSAGIVRQLGFPPERITTVENAVDTDHLAEMLKSVGQAEQDEARQRFQVSGDNVAVFLGSLYPDKRLDFLLEAAVLVRRAVPDFTLLIIGSGPQESLISEASQQHSWIRYVGPQFERDKVVLCSLGKLMMLPGLVGLAVLDAFALGLPLVTVDLPFHSPEIAYLEDGMNGLVLRRETTPQDYAESITELLGNNDLRHRLIRAGSQSADHYTVGNMANRFRSGIMSALNAPR